jgi:sugar O-acyltransferase (sialic acid O-acetyltransferase NeuD family)
MPIGKLTILGKSEATISMILDNLESRSNFPPIDIINNLQLPDKLKFINTLFSLFVTCDEDFDMSGDFIIGAMAPNAKDSIYERYKEEVPLEKYCNIIHKSAQIASTASVNKGTIINSLVSIAPHALLCNFVSINRNASVGHHTTLGEFVTLNPNAVVAGNVTIGANTTIGMGAIVLDGIIIGSNCSIGAGSVVTKDVPSNTIGWGNPFIKK